MQSFFSEYCRDVVRNISAACINTDCTTEYTGEQIKLLQEVTSQILSQVIKTPEGNNEGGDSSSLYAASQHLLEAVLNNLRAWHDFNTHLQSK